MKNDLKKGDFVKRTDFSYNDGSYEVNIGTIAIVLKIDKTKKIRSLAIVLGKTYLSYYTTYIKVYIFSTKKTETWNSEYAEKIF